MEYFLKKIDTSQGEETLISMARTTARLKRLNKNTRVANALKFERVFIYELGLYPLYLLSEMIRYQFSRFHKLPPLPVHTAVYWSERKMSALVLRKPREKLAQAVLDKTLKDERWLREKMDKYFDRMSELHKFLRAFNQQNIKNLTSRQLWRAIDEFRRRYVRMYLYGWVPNALEGYQNGFTELLYRYLAQHAPAGRVSEFISALTLTDRFIPRDAERKSFLRLAQRILRNARLRALFKRKTKEILDGLDTHHREFLSAIKAHRRKYAWLSFKYEGPEWTTVEVVALLKEFAAKSSAQEVRRETAALQNRPAHIRKDRETHFKILGLSSQDHWYAFFRLSQDLVYLKEHQKDFLFQCYYHLNFVLTESAKRLAVSPDQFRHLLHKEMKAALLRGRVDADELNRRIKCSFLDMRGAEIKVYTGARAEKMIAKYFPALPNTDKFSGQAVYPGRVKGTVRIVQKTEDIAKMKQGDVLVTTRTNPNLLAGIRKAGALVADIGGVTSHAAIVSRELRIPCVVGVGYASEVLKDGDRVEVDATRGIVRKI